MYFSNLFFFLPETGCRDASVVDFPFSLKATSLEDNNPVGLGRSLDFEFASCRSLTLCLRCRGTKDGILLLVEVE